MPEMEVETESLHEIVHEEHHKGHGHGGGHGQADDSGMRLLRTVSLTTAVLAVFASIAALKGGAYINEALLKEGKALILKNEELRAINEASIEQTRATNQWSYYQSKGQKQMLTELQRDLIASLGSGRAGDSAAALEALDQKSARYKAEQANIKIQAESNEAAAKIHLERAGDFNRKATVIEAGVPGDTHRHHQFAYAVALLQVAIALNAIAALARSKPMWIGSVGVGALGILFFTNGFLLFFGHPH